MPISLRTLAVLVLLFALAGCTSPRPGADDLRLREITPPFPASLDAHSPAIAADPHGRVALTFVTGEAGEQDLWLALSSDSGTAFSAPVRVNPRRGSVWSSGADRPVAAFGAAGAFAIAWTERLAAVAGASNVVVRASGDGGHTLGPTIVVNDDAPQATPVHHAMPALVFRPDGALFATWMDERDFARRGHPPQGATLYHSISLDGGRTWSVNLRLRDSVCPSCRPAVLSDEYGRVAVAYRASDDDIRDPAIAVSDDGETFMVDEVISPDGWRTKRCPGVGSAISWNRQDGGLYAWFTAAGDSGVYIAPWSADRGAMGLRRTVGDSLASATRPHLAAWDGSTLIGVEASPGFDSTRTVFAVRRLDAAGNFTPWTFLGGDVEEPCLMAAGERAALACWIERDGDRRWLRLVRLTPARS